MDKTFNDDARFDRLVDGELSADEYRALVASLDDEPAGWRRCALAFLESQAWAGELTGVRKGMTLSDDAIQSPTSMTPDKNVLPARKKTFRLTTILAMAASFLVAFALGIMMPRWFPAGGTSEPTVAEMPREKPAITNVATSDNHIQQPRIQSFKPIGNLQFVVNGPGESSTPIGDVPFYEYPGSADEWLNDQKPALSPEVLQTLEDRGHRIERQIEYVPVLLDDGRQVIVPIERYQIRPAQQRPY